MITRVTKKPFHQKKELWEFLKASIAYSKAKRKQMFHERTVLTKRLIRARQAFTQGDQSVWKTIQMLENQLKTLSRREIGVKIRRPLKKKTLHTLLHNLFSSWVQVRVGSSKSIKSRIHKYIFFFSLSSSFLFLFFCGDPPVELFSGVFHSSNAG